ncbi:MAG: undecaprenyl-diphosphate phosphatase [Pirellulales bacterium]|nr:undecaprenyl-diphosphate phosphatase [Pirellulales bacterium]
MLELIQAAVMGVIEGLTEFIPVSSTGHLILTGDVLDFSRAMGNEEVAKAFEVIIQVGAIAAVVAAYPGRFRRLLTFRRSEGFSGVYGLWLLGLTTLPALVFGYLAHDWINDNLFNRFTVAGGLAAGSLWIFWAERRTPRIRTESLDAVGWPSALWIGFFQCFALWPGVSRSAATILGGMTVGVDRKTSTEYSFFAAVPVLTAAAAYKFYKCLPLFRAEQIPLFVVGIVVSFLFGWIAVRFLIQFLRRHTLVSFGWYRLGLAAAILALAAVSALGWV